MQLLVTYLNPDESFPIHLNKIMLFYIYTNYNCYMSGMNHNPKACVISFYTDQP